MDYYGLTDIGRKRKDNQDAFSIDEIGEGKVLLTVCDGMGGVNGGQIASTRAIGVYTDFFISEYEKSEHNDTDKIGELMRSAAEQANRDVYNLSKSSRDLAGMGTTLVSAFVDGNKAIIANVGDSRIYACQEGELTIISHDHSYVQFLIDIGQITEEEAMTNSKRNIITRAIGIDKGVDVDIFNFEIKEKTTYPHTLLLCSDGLTNCLSLDAIKKILIKEESCEMKAQRLIDGANKNGGLDNITVIVAEI